MFQRLIELLRAENSERQSRRDVLEKTQYETTVLFNYQGYSNRQYHNVLKETYRELEITQRALKFLLSLVLIQTISSIETVIDRSKNFCRFNYIDELTEKVSSYFYVTHIRKFVKILGDQYHKRKQKTSLQTNQSLSDSFVNERASEILHNKTILVEQKTSTSFEVYAMNNSLSSTDNTKTSKVIVSSTNERKEKTKSNAMHSPSSTDNTKVYRVIVLSTK